MYVEIPHEDGLGFCGVEVSAGVQPCVVNGASRYLVVD